MRLLPLLACIAYAGAISTDGILSKAKAIEEFVVSTRRELHQIPERGSSEFKTSEAIKRILGELGVSFTQVFETGIVATIGTGKKPVVALRADIDALPIQEPEGFVPFRSQHQGWMHACGHDGHTSMLLGAAKLLKGVEPELKGTVRLVFQPNEEFGAGGEHVVKEGALEGVEAVFGMHVMPHIPSGQVGTRAGTIMAGALSFHIIIQGRGGHAAIPHLNVDPIVAAAGVISALQTLVSRETSPMGSAVLSVTLLRAGDAYNVIPDEAHFGGTIRGLDHALLQRLQGRVESLTTSVAAGYGCNVSVDWRLQEQPYYPPTVNDAATVAFTNEVVAKLLGADAPVAVEPLMAGEDFAFYCRAAPCTMAFLGIRNETLGSVHNLHNPKFLLDESVLHKGSALHAAWAVEYLARHGSSGASKSEL
eukprot:CAMPEP_0202861742 /NCGR_PEP_ID=MMETSP1391-20130828/3038_1 /ASSEMBLY_ACC=CAM_ASM_000867 /TAXON_ID=1034604 /ORGANISM="Chlamydomonas leiostraca, Strain SAG 11-49" /LENGTH=420 /DNA_ID=CAMNT_0049541175 /DNA_START=19 /DNA_END=1281 /DNA_ORIENTATION=-